MVSAGHVGDRRRPVRCLRHPVRLAEDVGAELVPADAVAGEKGAVLAPRLDQHMRHGEHHRGVGAGADRHPLGVEILLRVAAEGRDVHEPHAGRGRGAHQRQVVVPTAAARIDDAVLRREAAEAEHQLRVPPDGRPVRHAAEQHLRRAEDVRQQGLAGGVGVGGGRRGEAAALAEEAVELGARVVQPPGGGPAVGAAVDRRVAVLRAGAAHLVGEQPRRAVPGNGHEGVAAAQVPAALPFQPAPADVGPVDAAGGVDDVWCRLDQAARHRVGREGPHGRDAAVLDHGVEIAPMGGVRLDDGHRAPLRRQRRYFASSSPRRNGSGPRAGMARDATLAAGRAGSAQTRQALRTARPVGAGVLPGRVEVGRLAPGCQVWACILEQERGSECP